VKNIDMEKRVLVLMLASGVGGIAFGAIATRAFCWFQMPRSVSYTHDLEVLPSDFDWKGEVSSDVEIRFNSYVIKDGERKLEGSSFTWHPVTGEKEFRVYRDGSIVAVEAKRVRGD
jgi:hypothetical protein